MKSFRKQVLFLLVFTGVLVVACNKEKSPEQAPISESEATEYSVESMEADASFDDLTDIGLTAADEEGIISAGRAEGTAGKPFPFLRLRLRIGQKPTITVSPEDNTYPKVVTIDFGNGDNCPDGKFRKGKIVLNFTGPVRKPGSVVTITLVDFKLGRASITGTKVITNLSANGIVKFSVKISDATVTFPNGRGYTYEKTKTILQTAGETTNEISDDVYEIEGQAKTVYKNGVVVAINTLDALVKKVTCPWVSAGSLQVKVGDHAFSLDYSAPSNGDCDNKALLKWNSHEQIVVLP
jgi:hypothetical protein